MTSSGLKKSECGSAIRGAGQKAEPANTSGRPSCTDKLLSEIAVRHDVALDALSAMRGRRPLLVDVAVFVAFDVLFLAALRSMLNALDERRGDSRRIWIATTALVMVVMSVA